jgi:hypothetical protein
VAEDEKGPGKSDCQREGLENSLLHKFRKVFCLNFGFFLGIFWVFFAKPKIVSNFSGHPDSEQLVSPLSLSLFCPDAN